MTDLTRLTLRLPPAAADVLLLTAGAARLKPAVLARVLLLQALDGELPAPAPPAPASLANDSRSLLVALVATQSNLMHLTHHALELGEPMTRLSAPGGVLVQMGDQVRELGMRLKGGERAPASSDALKAAACQINDLVRRLDFNYDGMQMSDWYEPLKALKTALAAVNKE